jgi:hypothetical protein
LLSTALFGLIAPWIAVAGSSEREIPDRTPSNGPVQHAPMILRERHSPNNVTSSNWSGYAVTGPNDSVTDVKGSWKVPAIQGACPSSTQYASFWVGIDGYDTKTVEQIGTDSDCQNGSATYYAWYEFYPKFAYSIPIAIAPGDNISAEVSYGKEFTVSITNETTGKSWSHSEKVSNANRASAEWIIEASGGQPLANFGSVDFGQDYTGVLPRPTCDATVAGSSGPIGSAAFASNLVEITMKSNNTIMSQPCAISQDETSFTDTWGPVCIPPGS